MSALRKEDLEERNYERLIFHPAPLATLVPEKGAHFDLYLAIPSPTGQRYVLYKSSELDLTSEKCNYLLDRGVKNLYIADQDAPAYFEFVDRTLTEKLTSPHTSPKERSRILYTTTSSLVQATFTRPDSPVLIKTNRTLVEHTMKAIIAEPTVFRTMVSTFAMDYSLYTHSVNVATLGTGLLLEMQVGGHQNISNAAMGYLLHDIGKTRVRAEVLMKTGILSKQELQEIERHPLYGVELMQAHESIRPVAIEIIRSHHEKLDGSGYPYRLSADKIPLETRICSAVDIFDALTSNRPYKKAMSGYDTIQLILNHMSHELDREIVSVLIHLLGPKRTAPV
jgi:HD-GYP domain-containing protein (c-di-GMP phosphodiesterase class II)